MKQNKLLTLSLLASFLLLISASYSTAANSVTYGTVNVCPQKTGAKVDVPVTITNDVDLSAFDLVGKIVSISGGVDGTVTGVTFNNRMGLINVLDVRYPIGNLGGGIFRLGAVKNTGADLLVGTGQVATLEVTLSSDCKLGTASLDAATTNCDGHDVSTSFVDKNANSITPSPITSGAINVVNTPPAFTNCPTAPYTIYWGESVTLALAATDADLACGCDALTFSLVSGPGTVTGNVYQLVATPAMIGCNTVVVQVADKFGGVATCTFDVKVLNKPPVITCPGNAIILMGTTYTGTASATDPDHGPSALTYSKLSFDGPGTLTVDPVTGAISWPTLDQAAYIGTFNVCVKVTDGAKLDNCNTANADTCCFTIQVLPKFRVTIEKDEGTTGKGALQGHFTDVSVFIDAAWTTMNMGGFDFLISYDASALTLSSVEPGALLTTCGWEYFTYRFGPFGNCGSGCPSGLVRIVAMAETNNGAFHPTCFNNASGSELAVLTFLVTNDRTKECQYAPVMFYWLDCGDNTISSKFGDTLFLAQNVYFFDGSATPAFTGYPSNYGTSTDCLVGDKVKPLRAIDFKHGGVDIVCGDSIDAKGDINANGVAYEISDAVMFTNYFISGLSAFGGHVESSIAASDVNADGSVLTVADLVYLIRVIQGDAVPYAKKSTFDNFSVQTQLLNNELTVNYSADVNTGAALLVFAINGSVGTPTVTVPGMNIAYGVQGSELRVLVYNIDRPNAITAGSGALLTIPVNGTLDLREVEAADFYGNPMTVSVKNLPSAFALEQNYPNPFNPSTKIKLALPVASDYTLAIYNVAGQLIRAYNGNAVGNVEITWDGKDASGNQVASGMYFYKATASNFSATKKMVLMK